MRWKKKSNNLVLHKFTAWIFMKAWGFLDRTATKSCSYGFCCSAIVINENKNNMGNFGMAIFECIMIMIFLDQDLLDFQRKLMGIQQPQDTIWNLDGCVWLTVKHVSDSACNGVLASLGGYTPWKYYYATLLQLFCLPFRLIRSVQKSNMQLFWNNTTECNERFPSVDTLGRLI